MSEDQEITGGLGDQWVSNVISDARDSHPSISSDVFMVFEQMLHSKLSDRDLTPTNLREVATTLIRRFVLKTTEMEANNED